MDNNKQQNIEENADVRRMIKDGFSAYQISKRSGFSVPTITKYKTKLGVENFEPKFRHRNLLKDKKELVIKLHKEGKNCSEIAKVVGHDRSQVYTYLCKWGYTVKKTKYDLDETFFDSIDTQDKAYVLGWFYSDGNITKTCARIQIQSEDKYILETIKDLMGYTGPLYHVPPRKRFPDRKHQDCLTISRRHFVTKLVELGCVHNKGLQLEFPSPNIIPEHLLSHFIRGCFDGDGSIKRSKQSIVVGITSCDKFVQPLRDYLYCELDIPTRAYYRYKEDKENRPSLEMYISGTKNAAKFCDWIYTDANHYLTRKYDIYKKYKDECLSG